ncbi:MAG: gliding motility-associated-like protein [Cyclobacteriaceae bacterium]|jgi:gliding motility-associated-like protein
MRYLLTIAAVCLVLVSQAQQRPFINSLSKTNGTVGDVISIAGSGFTSTCKVYFGEGEATYTFNSSTLLTAVVPSNATYGVVRIIDTNSGFSGTSVKKFFLSFGGGAFSTDNFDNRLDFTTNNQLSTDLCSCDFNGDGKNDIAISNEDNTQINIFTNTSSGTTISFSNVSINNGNIATTVTTCGDLDGDGKAELLFSASLATAISHLFIYKNTSTNDVINMTLVDQFLLPDLADATGKNNPRRMKIGDIDADGINDIVVSSQFEAAIFVYRNLTPKAIDIETSPYKFFLEGISNLGALDIGDLNNDGLLDIVTLPFEGSQQRIYALRNISSPGEVKLLLDVVFASQGNRQNVIIGDLNNDGLQDIASTDRELGRIYIHQNATGNDGRIVLDNEQFFTADDVWGLNMGDINGDGNLDIVSASTNNALFFLINNGGSPDISMANAESITTASRNRNIVISDLNNDGKVDLAFTHRSISNTIGDLSVLTNRHCLAPQIGPTNLTFCLNSPFTLEATKTLNASYDWQVISNNGTVINNGDNASITVTSGTSVTISVTISSNDGKCSETSNIVLGMTNGNPPSAPSINSSNVSSPLCAGSNATLSGPAADNYYWTFPDGSTSENQDVELTKVTAANSGEYELRTQSGTNCISDPGFFTLVVNEPPVIGITNNGLDNFCIAGGSTELQVPAYAGFSYQWNNVDGLLTGKTNNTVTLNESSDYSASIISNESGCSYTSKTYTIKAVPLPNSIIDAIDEVCVDLPLSVTANSTGESSFSLNYSWEFGDGSGATSQTFSKSWSTAADYTVSLTTGYNEIDACTQTMTQKITVSAIPNVVITSASNTLTKCPSDSIRLELPQGFQSYQWSTGDTQFFTYAKTSGVANEVNVDATMITDIGCTVNSSQVVSNFPNSGIEFTSIEGTVEGDSIQLNETQLSVDVTAIVDGGSDYLWSPEELLSVTEGETVRIFPSRQVNDVIVTATDVNNCRESATVRIINQGVIPRKSFSPNGDGMGYDCWEILNTTNLQDCKVYIFDSRGRNVFVGDSPFVDNCVWNGNAEGGSTEAPEGIYYFAMKCDNNEFDQTGSILLGR